MGTTETEPFTNPYAPPAPPEALRSAHVGLASCVKLETVDKCMELGDGEHMALHVVRAVPPPREATE